MQEDLEETRLVSDTVVTHDRGIIHTTVVKDRRPYTTSMRLHDYIKHHKAAARVIQSAMEESRVDIEELARH